MSDSLTTLLDTAGRIVDTDLYPTRLRNVIAELATALRETSIALTESREYGLALVQELKDRAAKQDKFTKMASSMDADFQAFVSAVESLGAMPEGYCFCSKDRIGDDSKTHEPECRDIRAMLAARTTGDGMTDTGGAAFDLTQEIFDAYKAEIIRLTARVAELEGAASRMSDLLPDAFDVIDAPPPSYSDESIEVRDFRHSAYGRMKAFFEAAIAIRAALSTHTEEPKT